MSITIEEIQKFVENNIGRYHSKRLENLQTLDFLEIIKRKNPYLFKAKDLNAPKLVKSLLDAHLSSQEESMFGDFLEELAIYINNKIYGGQKSSTDGIDLDFTRDGIRYLVAIKSGPNWANKSQKKKLINDFNTAFKTLKTSHSRLSVKAVNGCCYGRVYSNNGVYEKLCGQRFWELVSGMENLYVDIIEPLGYKAKEKNETFKNEYDNRTTIFTHIFTLNFCKPNGSIDWEKIVKINSGKEKIKFKFVVPSEKDITINKTVETIINNESE